MKKNSFLFFMLVLVLLSFNVMSMSVVSQENQVTLKFVGWIGAEEAGRPAKDALIAGFEEKYPNIKIEVEDVPFREMPRRIVNMVVAGNAPDVAQIFQFSLPAHAQQGALESLDKYFTKNELEDLVNIYKYGDEITGVTWNPGISVMFYSKKLFEQVGIEKTPENFDEFVEDVEKIAALNPETYGWVQHLDFSPSAMYWHGPWLWSRGGGIWDENGNVIINNEGSLSQIEMLKQWAEQELIPLGLTGSEPRLMLANHRTGFMTDGPWTKGILVSASGVGLEEFDENWGVFPQHKIMPGKSVTSTSDHMLAMFKQSKHKDEAALFIKYLLSDEAQRIRFEVQGMLPGRKSQFNLPLYDNPYIHAFAESLSYVYNEKWTPNNEAISDRIVEAYQKVLYNDQPIKEAFDIAAREVELLTPEDWFKE